MLPHKACGDGLWTRPAKPAKRILIIKEAACATCQGRLFRPLCIAWCPVLARPTRALAPRSQGRKHTAQKCPSPPPVTVVASCMEAMFSQVRHGPTSTAPGLAPAEPAEPEPLPEPSAAREGGSAPREKRTHRVPALHADYDMSMEGLEGGSEACRGKRMRAGSSRDRLPYPVATAGALAEGGAGGVATQALVGTSHQTPASCECMQCTALL